MTFLFHCFQVEKLSSSLDKTVEKLDESKQLLKTNENGEKREETREIVCHDDVFNMTQQPSLLLAALIKI